MRSPHVQRCLGSYFGIDHGARARVYGVICLFLIVFSSLGGCSYASCQSETRKERVIGPVVPPWSRSNESCKCGGEADAWRMAPVNGVH